jgi:hypothetical protein
VERPGDDAVQARARGDVGDQLDRLREGVLGDRLHRAGQARPRLAGDAEDALADLGPPGAGREARGPDPPAAEREALAEPGGDHGPLRHHLGRAQQSRAPVEDDVAVDLVRDDQHVLLLGDRAELDDHLRRDQGAGRVVRRGQHQQARVPAARPQLGDRLAEQPGVGGASAGLWDRDELGPPPEQPRLRRVGHPRRLRQQHVAAHGRDHRQQQGLAPWRDHDLVGVGGDPAAGEVAGDRDPDRLVAGDRSVGGAASAGGEPVDQPWEQRQPGLPEAEGAGSARRPPAGARQPRRARGWERR